MKTKITIVTGEEFILDERPADFVDKLTNHVGIYITKMLAINEITRVNTAHIVKVESYEE